MKKIISDVTAAGIGVVLLPVLLGGVTIKNIAKSVKK